MNNILFENIFSNNKHFSSYKNLKKIMKQTLKKDRFETPKRTAIN